MLESSGLGFKEISRSSRLQAELKWNYVNVVHGSSQLNSQYYQRGKEVNIFSINNLQLGRYRDHF